MTASDNFNWAQKLARERLMAVDRQEFIKVSTGNPSDFDRLMPLWQDMPSLPGEVWAVVAEILASESDSFSISHLNASNWEIHDAALPILYETVHFKSLDELEHTVAFGDVKRWMHVK